MGNYRLKKHATTTNLCLILKKLRSNEPYQNSAIVLFKQLKKTLYVYSLNHDDLQYPFQIFKFIHQKRVKLSRKTRIIAITFTFFLLQCSKGNISTPFEQSYAILCTCVKNV